MSEVSVRNLDIAFGALKVLEALNLDISSGEFLVLLGPSGCGKSTLLNAIAGLLDISGGQIWIGDRNVTWDEPKDRGIGMVFQSYALYPRMTVEGNLSFGLQAARVPKAEIARRIEKVAKLLQIENLLQRRPSQLSGGQRQRVAIGRALVRNTTVFLFDEPLSNLDAKLRAELRVEIKRLHQELADNTMIYVTHDQIEALTLADRIAVMNGGVIQQLASPYDVYHNPVNRFVAGFIGSPSMNFIDGVVEANNGQPVFRVGDTQVPLDGYSFNSAAHDQRRVTFGVRPEHIAVGSAINGHHALSSTVELIEPMGADTLAWARVANAPLSIRTDSELNLKTGDEIRFGVDVKRCSLFDAESGERL